MKRVVVATLWDRVEVIGVVPQGVEPTPAQLQELAAAWTRENDGVRPTVRVVEQFGFSSA